MLSYTIKVYPIQNPTTKLVAFADVIIADKMVVKGFQVWKSGEGNIFATAPSQKSNKKDPNGKDIYYPTVAFIDPKENDTDKVTPLQAEILDAIVAEYRKGSGNTAAKTGATKAQVQTQTTTSTARRAGPLWGNS